MKTTKMALEFFKNFSTFCSNGEKVANKKEETCPHYNFILLHFIFVIIQLFLFPILSAQQTAAEFCKNFQHDFKRNSSEKIGGFASYLKKQRDIISSLLFSGQCGMGMKVNCQTDSQDKLLTMVKSSMKVQVSIGEIQAACKQH